MTSLTVERLKELLSYDSESGVFTWNVSVGSVRAGALAGYVCLNKRGKPYHKIRIERSNYLIHRLAWLYVHGAWPKHEVDHKDGNGLNNRIANLRDATHSQNQRNRGAQSNNPSGLKGVSWHKRDRKWRAQITINGKRKTLGSFRTPDAAHAAYERACIQEYGEYARVA
jgi:hypothetical protein